MKFLIVVALLMCTGLVFAKKAIVKKAVSKRAVGQRMAGKRAESVAKVSLYTRLGGVEILSAVVDQFIANCAGDIRVASFFGATAADAARMSRFKKNMVARLCVAAGGSCKYSGKDMKIAHADIPIKNEHFDAVLENFTQALTQLKIGAKEVAEVVKIVSAFRLSVVATK